MKKNLASRGFFLLLILFWVSNYEITAADGEPQQNEIVATSFNEILRHVSMQNVRISEIEVRDKQQEKEIAILKSASKDDKKEIEFLKNRVALLEAPADSNNYLDERKIKRPARLLPAAILYRRSNKTADDVDDSKRYFGPPTNCSDLAKLGYTLNGYYMTSNTNNEGSIEIVYCRFRQSNLILEKQKFGLETSIGNLQLKRKNNSVHFQVEWCYDVKGSNIIRFKKEQLNIGLAMNMKTGIFTAPISGVYHFQFTGLKHNYWGELYIYLEVNSNKKVYAYAAQEPMYLPLSLSTSMPLKANDRVHLFAQVPGKLYEGDYTYNYFTGWLVEDGSHH